MYNLRVVDVNKHSLAASSRVPTPLPLPSILCYNIPLHDIALRSLQLILGRIPYPFGYFAMM